MLENLIPDRGSCKPLLGLLFVCAALAAALSAAPARGELYRWTDERGQSHFTDNLFNVPQQYLPQIKTFRELEGEGETGDVPLARTDVGYVVEAVVGGVRKTRLVVDTGASATVLSPAVLKDLGVKISRNPPLVVRTVGGTVEAGWAEVSSIEVGPHKKGPLRVVVHDAIPGADGLLGMDYLGSFRVEILSAGPLLRLSPP